MSGSGECRTLRLFIALELPDPARRALAEWAAAELSGLEGIRLVAPDGLHVTLCFLGATPVSELRAVCAACRDAAAGWRSVELWPQRPVALPARRPSVLAVGIGGVGASGLAELQRAVSARMVAGGWCRPQSRPFLAHVTVARVRPGRRIGPPALERLGAIEAPTFVSDTVTVFRSHTRPDGARYEPLLRVKLAANG